MVKNWITFFKKMGQPRPLFHLFSSFQTHITILQQINVKKCPSSIRCPDLNSRPLEHESHPITTRPECFIGSMMASRVDNGPCYKERI